MDKSIKVDLVGCLTCRPLQCIVEEDIDVPMSSEGTGWDSAIGQAWFLSNPAERKHPRKATAMEAEENTILMRTMTHVRWWMTDSGTKEYQFKCDDMKNFMERNAAMKTKHQKLLETSVFLCSADIIRMFPFKTVQSWSRKQWHPVSRLLAPLRTHIEKVEKTVFTTYQLCASGIRCDFVYRASRETQTSRLVKHDFVYVSGEQVWRDYREEPWIIDMFKTLSNVYSFRTLQIGDGARGRAFNKRKATTTIVDVCTSDLPTAKTAQAFLLEDEQVVGTSDTVGIQWVTTDEQQDVPRSWLVRAAASKSLGCGLSVIDTSTPASRFDNMVPDPWPPLSNMNHRYLLLVQLAFL